MDKLVDKEQRSLYRAGNSLVLEDVVSSGRVKATDCQAAVVGDLAHTHQAFAFSLLSKL